MGICTFGKIEKILTFFGVCGILLVSTKECFYFDKEKVNDMAKKDETKNEESKKKDVKKKSSEKLKKKSLWEKFMIFCHGVGDEFKKVHWPTKKDMVKYSVATVVFVVFLSLFFYLVDIIFAFVHSLFR